jgi:hypothetical protein
MTQKLLTRHISRSLVCIGLMLVLVLAVTLMAVMRQAHAAAGPEGLLPNLVADPPNNVSLETSATGGGLSKAGEPRLLLRFNGYVHNKGPGAVDFRGNRKAPEVSPQTTVEVERAREKKESLPQKTEEELATPPMRVFQRLFTTAVEENNIERAHVEVPSAGEMIYVSADGHHHWHLQRVAKYSLWNSAKTAEVAPAQKVGFCLEDSQHVEVKIGPKEPAYADSSSEHPRHFCQQYRPNATGVFEGLSPGWRDVYERELSFQWVDASDVLPGEYWLREDVNPLGVIKETGGAKAPAYATSPTIIPGFDALAQATSAQTGEAKTLTLSSKAWSDSATPKYTIVSGPQHGMLQAGSSNQVIYRPASGYTGRDSFTFSSSDPSSPFPLHPSIATVSIEVAQPPVVGNVAQSNRTWREGKRLASFPSRHRRVALGTTFSFTLNEQAKVSFAFTQQVRGRKVNGKCLAQTNKNRRKGACKRTVTRGTLRFTGHAGKNKVSFQGRLSRSQRLKPGSYTLVITATNAVGHSSPRRLSFTIVSLPPGGGSRWFHYSVAAAVGAGADNVESVASGLTALTAGASWGTYSQGPAGFQAIGASTAQPSTAISGAPASMIAATSVSLTATVAHDGGGVEWNASAGTVAPQDAEGFNASYGAPTLAPAGGTITLTARLKENHAISDQRTITIMPVPTPEPAPAVGLAATTPAAPSARAGSTAGYGGTHGFTYSHRPAGVSYPNATLIGRKLLMTTLATEAGRIRLSAYTGKRLLGMCVTETPANRRFTCRLRLGPRVSRRARIGVLASLRTGGTVLRSWRPPAPIVEMQMKSVKSATSARADAGRGSAWLLWCSPSMRRSLAARLG